MSIATLWRQLANSFRSNSRYIPLYASVYYDSVTNKMFVIIDGPEPEDLLINIYDSSMNFLGRIPANEGIVPVPYLPDGKYFYKLVNSKGDLIRKGKFHVSVAG